jgi:hypothetical protein
MCTGTPSVLGLEATTMHAEQNERALEDLIVEFCDEDLQTWTRAAQVIGRRAVTDGASLEFLRRRLAEAPTATAQQGDAAGYQDTNLRADAGGVPRANVHRFRHACCAMGSYLSQPHPDESLLGDAIDEHIRYPLAMLCFDLLKSEGGTVADLKQIPGMAQQFEKWRRRQIASKQRNVHGHWRPTSGSCRPCKSWAIIHRSPRNSGQPRGKPRSVRTGRWHVTSRASRPPKPC